MSGVFSPAGSEPWRLRSPCRFCGEEFSGYMLRKNGQACVYCGKCARLVYNAPKTETGQASRRVVETVRRGLDPYTRARILERDGRCLRCGIGPDQAILHVGHFLSVHDGVEAGLTEKEINDDCNLLVLCEECNLIVGSTSLPPRLLPALIRSAIDREATKRKTLFSPDPAA